MAFYKTIGTRVKLLTPAGGCYDGKTGTVAGYRAKDLSPTDDPAQSHFAFVEFDTPASNCGEKATVFPWCQVFPVTTQGTYWRHHDQNQHREEA